MTACIFYKALFIYFLSQASAVDVEDLLPVTFYYWEIKPYIYEDANGQLRGMIVDFYEEMRRESVHCFTNETKRIVKFVSYYNNTNRRMYSDQITLNKSSRAIYGPFLEPVLPEKQSKHAAALVSADATALVTKRWHIDFTLKFWDTIAHMTHLFIIYLLTAIAFSVLYWLAVSTSTPETFSYNLLGTIAWCMWFC